MNRLLEVVKEIAARLITKEYVMANEPDDIREVINLYAWAIAEILKQYAREMNYTGTIDTSQPFDTAFAIYKSAQKK